MYWKKYLSYGMTCLLISGLLAPVISPVLSSAETKLLAEEEAAPGDSEEAEKKSDSSSDESSDSGKSSDQDSGGSDSGGSSSDTSASSDSGASSDSSSDSARESSANSSKDSATSSASDGASDKGKASSDSKDRSAGEEKEDASDKKEDKEKKSSTKKVVEDDANGRDYQASEVVSSGNLSFTIVSVSRDEESINKKIDRLKKKKKKLKEKKKEYTEEIAEVQVQIDAVQAVYDLIRQSKPDAENPDLYLMGCDRDSAYTVKEDRVEGLDQAIRALAEQYHDENLKSWIRHYSTELQPQSTQIDMMLRDDSKTVPYSDAGPLLTIMLHDAEDIRSAWQEKLQDAQDQMDDITDHISNLQEAKQATAIDLDSRLLEYKDIIPDAAIDFLNAVVSREGAPYVWGADGPTTFDCSGLVSYGLRQCHAVSAGFRWTSYDFASQLSSVSFEEAKPGDLVWKPGHIAIYIDENTVFEAPYTGARVRFTSCSVQSRFSRVLRWWSEE